VHEKNRDILEEIPGFCKIFSL